MGAALFSMHFGASCMLYPLTWGKESGQSVLAAFLGVFLTAILLPLLGYVALSRSKGTFLEMARTASPGFGVLFCSLLVIVNGPFYVIPRMSAAAWSAILQFSGLTPNNGVPIVLFNILYYMAVYWFLSSRTKTMDRLGKILSPVLIAIVVTVVVKGCTVPLGEAVISKSYEEPAVIYGFLQGYATGDLICALMFGVVILTSLKNTSLAEEHIQRNLLTVGAAGLGILAASHLGHMIVGAKTGGAIQLTLSALYTEVVVRLLGRTGGVIFLVALIAASMSTAVGIGAASAEYFTELFKIRVSYSRVLLAVCAVSLIMSCLGLESIISLMSPILDACYPSAIVLVAYFSCMPQRCSKRCLNGLRASMICAAVFALMHVLYIYNGTFGFCAAWYDAFYTSIPLSRYNFAWIPAAAAAYLVGLLLPAGKKYRPERRQGSRRRGPS